MSAKFRTGCQTNVRVGQMSVSDKCPCRTNVRLPVLCHAKRHMLNGVVYLYLYIPIYICKAWLFCVL